MARVAGVDLPSEKVVEVSLTYVYGIGRPLSKRVLAAARVDPHTRVRDLREDEVGRIREQLERVRVEGELRREVQTNIGRLREIGCYRGLRHRQSLPVRGQRTRTNARTRRGVRRTIGVRKRIIKRG